MYSRLQTGIPILAVFQNLRWISNKRSLLYKQWEFTKGRQVFFNYHWFINAQKWCEPEYFLHSLEFLQDLRIHWLSIHEWRWEMVLWGWNIAPWSIELRQHLWTYQHQNVFQYFWLHENHSMFRTTISVKIQLNEIMKINLLNQFWYKIAYDTN